MSKQDFFPTKSDADNRSANSGGPKQDNEGSAAKGKKITGGSGSGDHYKQNTQFGGK
ncbi:MAG: hypothetical protein ACYTE8_01025 [Planctomycetota bacterium]|jgi:hypothetical protein